MITLASLELLQVITKLLQNATNIPDNLLQKETVVLLIDSIGNLGLSFSYPNQLNDHLYYLLNRLSDVENKIWVLESIHSLFTKRLSLSETKSCIHFPISFQVLTPLLEYYNHPSQGNQLLYLTIRSTEFVVFYS